MQKDPVMENNEFQIYWLTHASSEAVFEWLKEQKPDFQWKNEKEIEKTLIDRNEPLTDLGLALYAKLDVKTARSLFQNGDRTIKKAVLAGPSIELALDNLLNASLGGGATLYGPLREIIDSFDEELLRPVLVNKSIPDHLLVSLYKKQEPFTNLTDEQWLRAIAFTASNPLLSTPYDGPMHPYSEVSYHEMFAAGWELFKTLPVNKNSAIVLSYLGESLLPHKPHDMDVLAIIKKWELESDKSDYYF